MKKILYVPHPVLRQKALKLETITKKDLNIAKEMFEIMIAAPGVGLAANQIGILKQIITIFFIDKDTNKEIKYILFNPTILSYSKKKIIMEEGCLSIPEQFADIERSEKITLEYVDESNKIIKKKVNGNEARILQHEIDHLSGKLFVDYLSSLKRNIILKKVKKLIRNKK